MRLLLDTHVVLWNLAGGDRLGPAARAALHDADEVFFSVVSCAEIGVKQSVGKLDVRGDLLAHVLKSGIRLLALSADHGLAIGALPLLHRDPFDRMLIAQARAEGLTLLSADARLVAYGVPVLDASA